MSLSAFFVDAVVIGNITSLQNYHRDWLMHLFSVRKVGKNQTQFKKNKPKSGSLYCNVIFAFCMKILGYYKINDLCHVKMNRGLNNKDRIQVC